MPPSSEPGSKELGEVRGLGPILHAQKGEPHRHRDDDHQRFTCVDQWEQRKPPKPGQNRTPPINLFATYAIREPREIKLRRHHNRCGDEPQLASCLWIKRAGCSDTVRNDERYQNIEGHLPTKGSSSEHNPLRGIWNGFNHWRRSNELITRLAILGFLQP